MPSAWQVSIDRHQPMTVLLARKFERLAGLTAGVDDFCSEAGDIESSIFGPRLDADALNHIG